MTGWRVRPALAGDAGAMATLLNAIIARGGTTAHETPFDATGIVAHYVAPPLGICCTLAQARGRILGFQALEWCDPHWNGPDPLPADWAVVASFVAPDAQGRGIARALWAVTRATASGAGVVAVDATIRADNAGGLGFYAALGFRDYGRLIGVPLAGGARVDRIRKRYDLG